MPNDQAKRLKARRTQIKAELTRFHTFLEKFNLSSGLLIQLETRFDTIRDILVEFKQVQGEYEEVLLENNVLDEDVASNERDQFETKYYEAISRASAIIQKARSQSTVNAAPKLGSNEESNIITNRDTVAKLPPLKIPEFAGSYSDWQCFYDTFKALVHNNNNLQNIEKFYYLQASLKGEAAHVITSLQISDANYSRAFNLLEDRYNNKKAIINAHLKEIFELPCLSKESHIQLRKFSDIFLRNLRALESLGEPVDSWNTILIYMLMSKLDIYSKREWENHIKEIEQPTLDHFTKFLNQRCQVLESLDSKSAISSTNRPTKEYPKAFYATNSESSTFSCPVCKGDHFIYLCSRFKNLSVESRFAEAKKLHLCINCLRKNHRTAECRSSGCKICSLKHNTLLHQNRANKSTNFSNSSQSLEPNKRQEHKEQDSKVSEVQNNTQVLSHYVKSQQNFVLLSTAIVRAYNAQNQPILCRVLLDSGSQSNFITRELAEKLKLPVTKINIPISGINQIKTNINYKTMLQIESRQNKFKTNITCLVIENITDLSPQISFETGDFNIPEVELADPDFNIPSGIDILIGCSLFFTLLSSGQIKLGKNLPVLQNSVFGWIIAGNIPINHQSSKCFFGRHNDSTELDEQLEKFWRIEEVTQSVKAVWTSEELECEQHFINNTSRNKSGRFIVKLPLKPNWTALGNSEERALNRLYSLEKRLANNAELKEQYKHFLKEYENLNHMIELPREEKLNIPNYYLPHHCVIKPTSITTRVRVVYDASAKTTANLSLNDVLLDGPVIQNDLFSILVRFRKHEVVLIGDLTKMYRQILVHPEQQNLQRIVWRNEPNEEVKHFKLQTLTYGTKPAAFLATRCLKQIAIENQKSYPIECDIINKDMYMDDVLTGASDSLSLNNIRERLSLLLAQYGFEIRKFQSNDNELLTNIEKTTDSQYILTDNITTKTLGVAWIPSLDVFRYKSHETHNNDQVTKRTILAFVAKLFDPLGLLGPVLIRFKILIQSLWQLKSDWDDPVPLEIYNQWIDLKNQFSQIHLIKIPRHVLTKHAKHISLHGFSDASEKAYACAVYLLSVNELNDVECHLLCAKSRVAPIKAVTLPRLELCGALLLSRLVKKCLDVLDLTINDIFMWTDSTIVLSWISCPPRTWKTFVANRVSEIQELSEIKNWHYTSSTENPSDIISRGANVTDIINSDLWWHGPAFIQQNRNSWAEKSNIINFSRSPGKIPEFTRSISLLADNVSVGQFDIFDKVSSYDKLVRIIAYCLRFISNAKEPQENRKSGLLVYNEIENSVIVLAKIVQASFFAKDLYDVKHNNSVSPKSNIKSLSPICDENGLLRVGGRLENTELSYDQKHPIILPDKHPFTRLLVKREHERSLHSGVHTTLSHVRQQFWPINGKNSVKLCIRRCIKCFKARPSDISFKMGQLPSARVTPSSPFLCSAIDFAGPFDLKDGKTKNRKIIKCYIGVFVCMATKAVHLELISDLTSEGFLSMLKRFVSRRGLCTDLYSDNATNFVGANNELTAIHTMINDEFVQNYLATSKINWHFIPARSPHFGGLWEAAVKSCKHHLKRILNQHFLTYEEFYSLLTQIEAVLNSRPITPLSSDPNDLNIITPGHFLIGRPLTAVPQRDLTRCKINYVKRYRLLQQMFQNFWSRWSKEYLHLLQQRNKWQFDKESPLKIGSIVIIKEDHVPPLCWSMGRIQALHPGLDNIVRVASIKTQNGVIKRSVNKLCALPIDDEYVL